MEQRRIGRRTVGAIGLGAMPMSVREHNDEAQGIRTIHRALDAGVTLIDTADAYSPDEATFGHSEDLVAKALASYDGSTDDVLVATKGGHTRHGTEWELDGRPAYLRAACEASLRRLGVDAIGLYQHHRPDPKVDYADTVGGLKALLDDGLIEAAGLSNADPRQIRLAHDILGDGLVSVQNQYSPAYRSSERELKVCEELGLAFLPWSPLGGMSDASDLGSRYGAFADVARRHGVSPQQVCLAWELSRSPVVIPIPGASRPESVADSVRATDLVLDDDEVARLSGASQPQP
jgi:aryl-alcohol dehydrogenase-like predicted oxidoreductase